MKEAVTQILLNLGWDHIPAWANMLIASVNVIIIVTLAMTAKSILRKLLNTVFQRISARAPGTEERKRIDTLTRIVGYIVSVVIGVITAMLILAELGISIAPFLATAGVAGIAISFGAQSLVKDYFTGFVMLLENQIRQGDSIDAAGKSGTVEAVTLRYVRLRDGEGAVHFIPNSSITTVTNNSRDYGYAVVDIGVSYDANLGETYQVIRKVGDDLRQDPIHSPTIFEDIEVLGVNQLADSSVNIRVRIKTEAGAKGAIRRELLARIKLAFDAHGIDIPFPQRVLRVQQENVVVGANTATSTAVID